MRKLNRSKKKYLRTERDHEILKTPNKFPRHIITNLQVPAGSLSSAEQEEFEAELKNLLNRESGEISGRRNFLMRSSCNLVRKTTDFENNSIPHVMVMRDDKPRATFVLDRGDYLNPKKDQRVDFAPPKFLPSLADDAPKNRLGFARWLFQSDNPLTARVQVNRMWQAIFGIGLSKTTEDFGVQGEHPVHQELLDWLAVEFRERGWSMKQLNRLIVTSATYRQSSKVTPELLQIDPENRLMARAPRFRMPSMILRDLALSASGLIDLRTFGEPVYPYQPEGVWVSLSITKERNFEYPQSSGNDLYRRSLYTFWRARLLRRICLTLHLVRLAKCGLRSLRLRCMP